MRRYLVVLALASGLGVAGTIASGCAKEVHHPPELSAASSGTALPDDAVDCVDLVPDSEELRAQVPGPLKDDAGTISCLVSGVVCPLHDSDAGVCDGGHEAGSPVARCEGSTWHGVCIGPDGAAQ